MYRQRHGPRAGPPKLRQPIRPPPRGGGSSVGVTLSCPLHPSAVRPSRRLSTAARNRDRRWLSHVHIVRRLFVSHHSERQLLRRSEAADPEYAKLVRAKYARGPGN